MSQYKPTLIEHVHIFIQSNRCQGWAAHPSQSYEIWDSIQLTNGIP